MNKKEALRFKRHNRIKLKVRGSASKPRLVVRRSLKNFSAQVVDDDANKVLFSISTRDKDIKAKFPSAGNVKASETLGELAGRRIQDKGIKEIVFDRAGYLYHGRVKAFADALRKGGVIF